MVERRRARSDGVAAREQRGGVKVRSLGCDGVGTRATRWPVALAGAVRAPVACVRLCFVTVRTRDIRRRYGSYTQTRRPIQHEVNRKKLLFTGNPIGYTAFLSAIGSDYIVRSPPHNRTHNDNTPGIAQPRGRNPFITQPQHSLAFGSRSFAVLPVDGSLKPAESMCQLGSGHLQSLARSRVGVGTGRVP